MRQPAAREGARLGAHGTAPTDRATEATERLAAIVDAADDAIIATDLDNTITSWNRGAERMFGYAADEVVGRSMLFLEPKGYEGETRTVLNRAASGEVVKRYETVRRHKDGTLVSVSIIASPMRDSEGRVYGTARIIRDSTAERRDRQALIQANEQLLRARRELDAILDSGQSGILAVDRDGNILYHNEAAERLLGTKPKDMPFELWPGHYGIRRPDGETEIPADELPAARALGGETIRVCEVAIVRPGAAALTSLLVSSAPIRDAEGTVVAAVSTFQDVTELKSARRDLERMRAKLDLH